MGQKIRESRGSLGGIKKEYRRNVKNSDPLKDCFSKVDSMAEK
jgi:hypothetical protein